MEYVGILSGLATMGGSFYLLAFRELQKASAVGMFFTFLIGAWVLSEGIKLL